MNSQSITKGFTTLLFLLLFICPKSAFTQLHVNPGKRYLQQNDSTFLWIGDTAWELFHALSIENASYYLQTRAAQGFTVIQAVVLPERDGLRIPNIYGELPFRNMQPTQPNERYFKHIDEVIDQAARLGLQIALLPTWGDKVFSDRPGDGPVIFNEANAYRYGKFLGKRYRNKPVIWMLGGDRNVSNLEVKAIWDAMAKGLQAGDEGKHLITYHPAGESTSANWFHNAPWLAFNSYQSGHAKRFFPVYQMAARHLLLQPPKPFIEAEPAYEGIPIRFWEFMDWNTPQRVPTTILDGNNCLADTAYFKYGYFTDYDVRVQAYWNFLSGACGYTYGNNAVWQFFEHRGFFQIPCLNDWKTALHSPGADGIKHLKKLLLARNFAKLTPDQSLIFGSTGKDSTYTCGAVANDHSFALVYAALGQAFQVDLSKLKGAVKAYWYHPKNGTIHPIASYSIHTITRFIPPTNGDGNDWLLVLDSEEADLPAIVQIDYCDTLLTTPQKQLIPDQTPFPRPQHGEKQRRQLL